MEAEQVLKLLREETVVAADERNNEGALREDGNHIVLWQSARLAVCGEPEAEHAQEEAEEAPAVDLVVWDEHDPAANGEAASELDDLPVEEFRLVAARQKLGGPRIGTLWLATSELVLVAHKKKREARHHAHWP
eukprot:7391770-Prymnesium_polylepis.2